MTILIVVSAQDAEGEGHGIAAEVPDGWLDDPAKSETLMYGAMMMFIEHVRKVGAKFMIGHDINIELREIQ